MSKMKVKLLAAFAALCLVAGFATDGWPSLLFLMLGAVSGSFGLYESLLSQLPPSEAGAQARNRAWRVFVVLFAGVIFFWRELKVPQKPHFELGVALAEGNGGPLMLTNDVFKFPIKGQRAEFDLSDVRGFVVIPVAPGTHDVKVNFVLSNETEHVINNVGVKVSLRTNAPFVLAPEWHGGSVEDGKHANYECSISAAPPSNSQVPFITFGKFGGKATDVDVTVNMKNGPPIEAWGLQVLCMEMPQAGRPFATLGKINGMTKDGSLRWNFNASFGFETNASGKVTKQGNGVW